MYAAAQAAQQSAPGTESQDATEAPGDGGEEDVVDAEIVDEDKEDK